MECRPSWCGFGHKHHKDQQSLLLTSLLEGLPMNVLVFWYDLFMKVSEYNFVLFIFTFHQYNFICYFHILPYLDVDFGTKCHIIEILVVITHWSAVWNGKIITPGKKLRSNSGDLKCPRKYQDMTKHIIALLDLIVEKHSDTDTCVCTNDR